MGNLVKMQAAGCGPDVRGLFAKIDQTSLAYYEFETVAEGDDLARTASSDVTSRTSLLRGWRSPEAQPAAHASLRLDALFARLSASARGET
ncbi:hypothetical protein P7B02_04360 [Caulobacter segnis]|uniref:hypothetical protein n=1 Tax=Caulobacter segnis TaxID=88688 RepID=UPI0024108710|nr:hypothetical protein [Caulobacter segnis]MDG2520767.1 hypothetical protein [Caulobacter segnis]